MKKLVIISSFLFLMMQINCIKKDFTPTITNVNDEQYMKMVNTTIAELRSWLPTGSIVYKIPEEANWVIQGVIVSSDVNSNFYKCIHIQDSTAGIQLMIDGSGLYALYPVGMRVFVKLAGLGLTTYNNQLELGLVDNTNQKVINIPVKLLDKYIVKGSLNNSVDTLKISDITTLSSIYQSRLVKLANVIIDTNYAGKKTMGDVVSQSSSYTIPIQDSRKNTVILSTSPYAIFANQLAPEGAGYILAIATQYGTDMQLAIRGMEDIHFNKDDTIVPNTAIPDNWKIMKISEVRSWKGNISRLPMVGDTAIRGIVVSDNLFVNMPDSQLFIQDPDDNNRAICIFLNKRATDIKFKHGDEIVVNLKGAVLTSQNAGKVIASFAANHGARVKDPTIVIVGAGKSITPVPVNLDDLVIDLATENPIHEAQLIKVENGYFGSRQGQTFSGNIYLSQKDNNQQLTSYTKPAYTGGNLVPNGLCNVTTLVAKYYGGYEFIFRMPTDIEDLHIDPPTVVNPSGCALYEDFDVRTGGSYVGATAVVNSGTWFIAGYATMTEGSDRYEGTKSIRLRGNSSDATLGGNMIQMNFDKTDGIGIVKFKYASYSTHSGGKFFVEYSTDEGANWTRSTTSFTAPAWGGSMIDAEVPINVSGSVRIRIKKDVQSVSTSVNIDNICIGDYVPTADMPTFTPPAGTYVVATQSVTISTLTPGANIYYTLNGSNPVLGNPSTFEYATNPINLVPNIIPYTIKAIAVDGSGSLANSNVTTATYTIQAPGVVQTPTFDGGAGGGTFTTSKSVVIACATAGATIWYTTNGDDPSNASGSRKIIASGSSISITQNTTLRAIAEVGGMTTSAEKSAVYTIQVATPTITPASGTSATLPATITVRISAVPGATIYYTTNGSTPTTSSAIYTGDASGDTILYSAGNIAIKAIAVKNGMTNSDVASATYTINPAGGSGTQTITWDYTTTTSNTTSLGSSSGVISGALTLYTGATITSSTGTASPSVYFGGGATGITNWTTGAYWLFTFSNVTITTGFSWNYYTYGTNTSPANWELLYSIDNSTWISCTTYTIASTMTAFPGININGNKTVAAGTYSNFYIKIIPTNAVSVNGGSVATSSANNRLVTGVASSKGSPITFTFN